MAEQSLSQDEADALMKGVTGEVDEEVAPEEQGAIRSYDLATQERIVRGRMPTLEIINERFARLFRTGLFNLLRRAAEISVEPVKIYKYSEFVRNLVVPANLNLVHVKPFRGSGLIVFDAKLVFLLVDNMFGGDGRFRPRIEGREFTATEQRIIMRVIEIFFGAYAEAWAPVHAIQPEYVRSEMHTQFTNIAMPNEVVISTAFTVEIGSVSGGLHICIPYSMVEPIRDKLTSNIQGETLAVDKRWVQLLKQQIQTAEVELVAHFGTARLTCSDLLYLQVGDVIPLHTAKTVQVYIDSVPVLECSYGKLNGQYALRIEKLLCMALQETDARQGELHE